MRLALPKILLLPFFALLWFSCDQEINSARDQPSVNYVLVVTDSISSSPLDSVRARVTTISGDTSSYFTDAAEGRVELPSLPSSRTLFVLSRKGYRTLDLIDTVSSLPDTIFNRPVARLLRVRMARLVAVLGNHSQFTVAFRNADLEKLRKGKITFTDSLNSEKTVVDTDSDGTVELAGLKTGGNTVRVEHPGYLGRLVDVNVVRLADTIRVIPGTTLTLVPRSSGISGQAYYKTFIGSKPLLDAKVEFILKDSLAFPNRFTTLTSSAAGSEGRYVIADLPALDGEVRFYKNKTAAEPTLSRPITKEEVLRDGPSSQVILSISSDSLSLPVADSLPKDTLNPKDTLIFHFNQRVEKLGEPLVRLINFSNRLYTVAKLDAATNRTLKIVQKEDDWQVGKIYQYELTLENAQGQVFTRPGDSSTVIRGTFFIKEKADTNLAVKYPQGLRLAFFNSGIDRRFDSSAAETSSKADSSTRFARMKWKQDGAGNRVDSLLVMIKDGLDYQSWFQWQSIPGFVDSATLDFAELYSTSSTPTQLKEFPLRKSISEEIQLRILYKEGGKTLDSETVLVPLIQGMGPQVYAHYNPGAGLESGLGAKDTIEVTFRTKLTDAATAIGFGANTPEPFIFVNDVRDRTHLQWEWIDGKRGRLIYTYSLSESPPARARFRADVSGIISASGPIWQRNRKDAQGLE